MKWKQVSDSEAMNEAGYRLIKFSDNRHTGSIQYSVTRPGEGNPFHYTRDRDGINEIVKADMEARYASKG